VRLSQHWFGSITVLDVRRMDMHDEQVAFRVNGQMALTPIGLFSTIIAALPTGVESHQMSGVVAGGALEPFCDVTAVFLGGLRHS
jgi:hypothetical protein